jgi:hypothetical protein
VVIRLCKKDQTLFVAAPTIQSGTVSATAQAPGRKKGDQQVMPLVQVVIVLVVVGFLLWLVNRLIPMQSTIKSILNAVVVICVALWLLNVFGVLHSISKIRVGR